ncbi:MAG TPA: hypothetical protein VN739_09435 [Nitrososphaerales archaeon]|nr:hypothetical protein [Nitrososphaerales archaeon]
MTRYLSLLIIPLLVFQFYGSSDIFASSSLHLTISTTANGGSYSSQLSELINLYVAPRFNSSVGLVAQGFPNNTSVLGDLGVIHFENGTIAPNSTESTRFEPACCSWKAGWGLVDNEPASDPTMGLQILHTMSTLNSTFGWHSNWIDDSIYGVPIPYKSNNTAIAYTLHNGSFPETSNGVRYEVAQNSPYNLNCPCWNAPDLNATHGLETTWKNPSAQQAIYQSLNFFIRGDNADAISNFQWVASIWNGTGFVDANVASGKHGFFRGEILALFLYAQKVLNVQPNLPNGATLGQIEAKLWSLQSSDGGIAYQYTTASINHSDDETTEAALLPYSPTLIAYVQSIAKSGLYNLTSSPPSNFVIDPLISGSIKLTAPESGVAPGAFGLSGCDVTPSSFSGDGAAHAFVAERDCLITVTAPLAGISTRYSFAGPSALESFTTCKTGTCAEQDYSYYYQIHESISYSVSDGSVAPSNPTLNGVQLGSAYGQGLSTVSNLVWLDAYSNWSVSPNTLIGSTSTQRWFAPTFALSGTVTLGSAISPEFLHQFLVTFASSPTVGGTAVPLSGWFNASSVIPITANANSGYAFSKWSSSTVSNTISSANSLATSATIHASGTITAQFVAGVTTKLSSVSGKVAPGRSVTTTLTISGIPQSVTLSHGTLPRGITVKFAHNPTSDSKTGVTDVITILTSSSVHSGTYQIVFTATGADGQKSAIGYTLTVT